MLRLDPFALNIRDHAHVQIEEHTDYVLVTMYFVSTYDTLCHSVLVNTTSAFVFHQSIIIRNKILCVHVYIICV